jgi:hypothetical protein
MPESLGNKGDSSIAAVGESVSGVQGSDCDGCSSGHRFDKQNDKRVGTDPGLQQVSVQEAILMRPMKNYPLPVTDTFH